MKTLKGYIYLLILSTFSLSFAMQNQTELNKQLAVAIFNNNKALAENLIKDGADVNYQGDETHQPPLMTAAVYHKDPYLVRFLLKKGANPSLVSMGPLYGGKNVYEALENVKKIHETLGYEDFVSRINHVQDVLKEYDKSN